MLFRSDLDLLAALQPHLLAHDGHEVVLMVQDMVRHHLDVVQHQMLQNGLPNVVGAALLLVLPVNRTIEERILGLIVVGGTVIHLCTAVGAEQQAREHAGSSSAGHAVALLVDLLGLFKHIVLNDALMGVREHGLIFQWVFPLLFVSGRRQHLIRSQLIGDLGRATALHAHGKDPLDHLCGLRVDDPVLGIVRVLHVAIRDIGGQRHALFSLGLLDSTDLAAGVTGAKLVKKVADG